MEGVIGERRRCAASGEWSGREGEAAERVARVAARCRGNVGPGPYETAKVKLPLLRAGPGRFGRLRWIPLALFAHDLLEDLGHIVDAFDDGPGDVDRLFFLQRQHHGVARARVDFDEFGSKFVFLA